MTNIKEEMLPKLRRLIGDTEEPYAYTDTLLIEYIEDSFDGLYLDWQHDYVVDRSLHGVNPEVIPPHQILFVMKAKLDIIERQSDNSFRAGSVYITKKHDNEDRLRDDLEKIINNILARECIGRSQTEFDDFKNYAYKDWGIKKWIMNDIY
jgi:hypothetical protein